MNESDDLADLNIHDSGSNFNLKNRRSKTMFSLLVGLTLVAQLAQAGHINRRQTPLVHDDMPCLAENLRETDHYICNDDNEMICLSGWSEPANQCRTPVCQFRTAEADVTKTCKHGDCARPNVCACEVGWDGVACDECIPLPGCLDGTCDDAFECNCRNASRYTGASCDIPVCREGCANGYCVDPQECICEDGWSGQLCDECITLPGCLNGHCSTSPLECTCNEGWMGSLCDCPICKKGCNMDHGFCTNENSSTDECICYPGYKGETCNECIKYPGCPSEGYCTEPWECLCPSGVNHKYCNTTVKHNLLPEYYHHEMSKTCCEMNKALSAMSGKGNTQEDSKFDFNLGFGGGDCSHIQIPVLNFKFIVYKHANVINASFIRASNNSIHNDINSISSDKSIYNKHKNHVYNKSDYYNPFICTSIYGDVNNNSIFHNNSYNDSNYIGSAIYGNVNNTESIFHNNKKGTFHNYNKSSSHNNSNHNVTNTKSIFHNNYNYNKSASNRKSDHDINHKNFICNNNIYKNYIYSYSINNNINNCNKTFTYSNNACKDNHFYNKSDCYNHFIFSSIYGDVNNIKSIFHNNFYNESNYICNNLTGSSIYSDNDNTKPIHEKNFIYDKNSFNNYNYNKNSINNNSTFDDNFINSNPSYTRNSISNYKTTSKESTTTIKSEPGTNSDYYEEWETNGTTANPVSFTTPEWNTEELQTSSDRDFGQSDVSKPPSTPTSSHREGSNFNDSEKDAPFGDANTTVTMDTTDSIMESLTTTPNMSPSDSIDFEFFTSEPTSKDPVPTSTDLDNHSTEGEASTINTSTTSLDENVNATSGNAITTTVNMGSSSTGSTLNPDSQELFDPTNDNTTEPRVTHITVNTGETSTLQPDRVAIWVSTTTTSVSSKPSVINESFTTTPPVGEESKSSKNLESEATPNPDSSISINLTKPSIDDDSDYYEESGTNQIDSELSTTSASSEESVISVTTSSIFNSSETASKPQEDSEQSSIGTTRSLTMASTESDDLFEDSSYYNEESEAKTTTLDFNSTLSLEITKTTQSERDTDSSSDEESDLNVTKSIDFSAPEIIDDSNTFNSEASKSDTFTTIADSGTTEFVTTPSTESHELTNSTNSIDEDGSDYYQEVEANNTDVTITERITPTPTKPLQTSETSSSHPQTNFSTGKYENNTTDSPDYYEPSIVNGTIMQTGTTRSSLEANIDSNTFESPGTLHIQSSTTVTVNQDDNGPSWPQNNNTKEFSDTTVHPDLPELSNSNTSSQEENSDYHEDLDSNSSDPTTTSTIRAGANASTTIRTTSSIKEPFTLSSDGSLASQVLQENSFTQTTFSPKSDEFTRSTFDSEVVVSTTSINSAETENPTLVSNSHDATTSQTEASSTASISSESNSTSIPRNDTLINFPTSTVNLSTEAPTTVENGLTGNPQSNNDSAQNSTQDYADYTEEIGDVYDFRNFTEPLTTPIKSIPGSSSVPTPLATTVDYVDDSPDTIGITDSNLTTSAPSGVSIKSDDPGLASNVTEEYYEYYEIFDNTTNQINNESATEQSSQVLSTTGRQTRSSEAHDEESNQASRVTVTVQNGFSITLLPTVAENSSPVFVPVVDSRSLDEDKTVKPQTNDFPDVRGDFGDMTSTEVNDYLDAFNTTTSFEELLSTIFSLHHSTDPVEREKRNSEKPSPRSDMDESEDTLDQHMDTTQNPASTILDDWFVDQFDTLLLPTSTTPFPETAVQIKVAEEPDLDEIRRLNTNDLSELGIHNSAQMDRLSRLAPQFKKSDSDKHRGVFVTFTDRFNGTKSGSTS
eukprot:TCALIF_12421-PA protein Name:"Similar to wif1 Wnt inhibitory factor 1 (Xenopus laevis)" AED:0.16 eAED:0.16 QI:0/0.38/0.42/0.85/0.53/0.57/14/174/1791